MDGPCTPGATRRELLAGLGALALAPSVRAAGPIDLLRSIFDRAERAGKPADSLAILRRAPAERLGQVDRAILRMVTRGVERDVALSLAFPFGKAGGGSPYVLSQRHGAWLELGAAGSSPPDMVRRLDEETGRLSAEAGRGLIPPLFMLDSVLEAERALHDKVAPELRPALRRQMQALDRLRPGAPSAPGVWRLPGGEEYYRLRLRCTSGVDDGPERIERRVAQETAALLERADDILKRLGLKTGSVGARLRVLKRRPEHLYTNDDSGRARAVAAMNEALAGFRPKLPFLFNAPLELGSRVRRMAPADERSGRRGYRDPPTAAGPGAYYPDLSALHERPGWTLIPVVFHETAPGHLLQLGHQALADPHPLQIRYAPGYLEGWAIYAEMLVGDVAWGPEDQLGFIQSRLFRLARVTVDLGLHLRRWDRARAIRYLEETVGFDLFFPFAVEVDRYAAEPAAFAGDALVANELRRLSEPGRNGGPVALRRYHDSVLNRGPVSAETIGRIV